MCVCVGVGKGQKVALLNVDRDGHSSSCSHLPDDGAECEWLCVLM